ncbi:hypothetical protein TVAG_250620 [Trichomonas vaginalis G3]|uniref:Uncharacterized protein n=1 Tax=Trichomonas vaginalis (strain ATCC PRA-98 / G3) TaxID=412133 RepID=A2ESR1_TRIV3|nr:hypothetical protein TVAGG3_0826340 [Trichomonas vaginalis G3]EAY04302.1 hypothetical protein TVAG_250620 [Trichomonas vaginalis G3]KAI5498263.1 hypothetical protein TVAGG3_0826340 [Trichomonas vaginalis G3]|eukprot:XP_001316525.1 hypothetical protein [Trichomonas vaginalis G3]
MSEGYEPPWWFPISTAMAMRHVAETEMNLENFENYLMLRMNHDPEELIEVVRFLGIFKSQRKRLTLMLSMFKCNSIYYNYQFYVFKRVFTAHECGCPKFYQENLDKLHREFLVGLTLFWKARENNEKIKAFIYATKTAFTHIEMINLVNYLVYVYHYDYLCHQSYSEILLVAQGEPRKSYLYRRFANILRDSPNSVPDFIFKKIEQYYPLSHEMFQNEVSKSEDTFSRGSGSSKTNGYSQLRFHIDESTIYREDDKDNSNIAMMVIKSKRFKALGLITAFVISLIWACLYSDKTMRLQDKRDKSIMNIKNLVSETIDTSTKLSAGLIMQPILIKYKNEIKDPEKCKEILPMIYEDIKEYLGYVNKNYQFFTKSLCYYSEYIAKSDCRTLSNSSKVIVETLNLINKNYQYFDQNISTIFNINFSKVHLKLSLLLLLLSFVGGFISLTLTFFNVNYSLKNIPKEAYQFLASNERLSLMLLKKSLEMCDLFQLIFPRNDKNDIPKPIIKPPSINTQNLKERRTLNVIKASARKHISISPCTPHVSLKDAKVRVSFLGADQMLSPATFALMSPFVSSSTPPTALNASNSSFLCSSNSSNTSASASEVEDDFSDSSIFENSANEATSPPNELTIPADSVNTMELVTKTIENTKSNYKILNVNLLLMFIFPWLMTYLIVLYSGIVINFQQNKNLEFMNNIYKDIKEFHILPEKMYKLYMNESNYIKNTKKMIKQLSKHSRNLPNLVENADVVLSFSLTGWLSWSIFAYVLWIILGCAMYHIEQSLDEGYDSLFHFPTSYIDDIKQEKDSAPQELSADNILEIYMSFKPGSIAANA